MTSHAYPQPSSSLIKGLWKQIEEEFGGISLEQFAEMSENGAA